MTTRYLILAVALNIACTASSIAQTKARTHARLIWQDAAEQTLRWGDVKKGKEWSLKPESISGHPDLDPERHRLVQMRCVENVALVGVRDDDDGAFKSGWFALDSGVTKEAHGDHCHWKFASAPKVISAILDEHQGNPAHVYLYQGSFYIANDKKNGFTLVSPSLLGKAGRQPDQFYEAGGGHITLAVVQEQVAYATWIDREGENKGRVDILGLGSNADRNYHIHLPSGGIHGATTNSGKVFFAPSDGIYWVSADTSVTATEESVHVHHVSLGKNEDGTPKRTGAFENAGNSVLFTVGRSDPPELCILDASSAKPSVSRVVVSVANGSKLSTPKAVQSRTGKQFALMFEESPSGEHDEMLHVVALDPNRDGRFEDASLHNSIPIGLSLIEGHSGRHAAIALSRRFVAVSNPGDGTITIISTSNWETESTLKVGGTPTRMVAAGGQR